MKSVFTCLCLMVASAQASRALNDPRGAGHPEDTKGQACAECKKHEEYLADCSCHATDIMGTFANDATKELTSAEGYGSTTVNTGVKRLPEGWMWHCRPVSATEGLWQQC